MRSIYKQNEGTAKPSFQCRNDATHFSPTTLIPLIRSLDGQRHPRHQVFPWKYRLAVDYGAVERPLRTVGQNNWTVCNAVEVTVLALRCRDDDVFVRNFDGLGCPRVSFPMLLWPALHSPNSK